MTEPEAIKNIRQGIECIKEDMLLDMDFIPTFELAIKALERQIEINNMALIQSHRKCVLGRDEMYSDSTLQSMSKAELINLLHVAQHNYSVLLETLDGRVKYYEKELASMSDEVKWED